MDTQQFVEKFARITSELEKHGIIFEGLVNGLVQTYHKNHPNRKLNQNPMWWHSAPEQEIIDGLVRTFVDYKK